MARPGLLIDLRQQRKQSQTLTPALQQSIKLLQLSGTGLEAIVREALETNPLLALDDPPDDSADKTPKAPRRDPAGGYRPTPAATRLFGAAAGAASGADRRNAPATGRGEEVTALSREPSLRDVLFEDIAYSFADAGERNIAVDLSGLLDESGYLAGDIGDVAALHGVPEAQVADVLSRLQALAPAGLFARTLSECLRLQLVDAGSLDPGMDAVLNNLPLLTGRGPDALAAAAGIDRDALPLYLERLRTLDPRPGLALAGTGAPAVVPDLIVRPADEPPGYDGEHARQVGRWVVAVNPDTVPRLSLDRAGLEALRARSRDGAERAYLRDRSQEATWLIQAVEKRMATILLVGIEIFRRQQEFLERGTTGLRPMTRKDIARATDLHESTISRAANDKFAATPQGVFALKFLFSARIDDLNGGPGYAASAVRHRLRILIDGEAGPLSDEAVTRMLRAEGYDVARRTVAKYREMLRIPSSVERRRRLRTGLTPPPPSEKNSVSLS